MSSLFTLFAANCTHNFFGFVPWYKYLELDSKCDIVKFNIFSSHDIGLILLAVINDLLRLAGILAIGYVLYGAIRYILSQGNPEETAKAQSTIINALIGLVIAMLAVALVSFIGNQISG